MEGFTLADIVIALVLGASSLWGFFRGFAREIADLGSWILAALGAARFMHQVVPYVEPYLGAGLPSQALSFLIVFVLLLVLFTLILTPIFKLVKIKNLAALDKLSGLLFGLARGLFITGVLWVLYYGVFQPADKTDVVIGARLAPTIHQAAWAVHNGTVAMGDFFGWMDYDSAASLLIAPRDYLLELDTILRQGALTPVAPDGFEPRTGQNSGYSDLKPVFGTGEVSPYAV